MRRREPAAASTGCGELLGAPSEALRVTFHLTDGGQDYCVEAGPDGSAVSAAPSAPADVEVLVDDDTWALLADGALAPLEAFALGRMRVRGDINVARRFVRQLRRDETEEK
jgi:putative sterol carrier protein